MGQYSYNIIDDGYPSDVAEFISKETTLDLDCDNDDLELIWLTGGRIIVVNKTKHWVLIIRTRYDDDSGVHSVTGWRPYWIASVDDRVYLPANSPLSKTAS